MGNVGVEGSPSPLPGARPFGKYYLLDRIGSGGMAEVFLAVASGPEGFQRTLVIKRMLPHLSQDRAFVRMFVDEAKLCGLLSHPNLVQIFEFGAIEESFFIAMEHVQGETLSAVRQKLAEHSRLAPVAASAGDRAPGLPRVALRPFVDLGVGAAAGHHPPRHLAV